MKRALYLAPLLVFAAVAAWFAIGLGRDPQLLPSALIDRPVPAFTLPAVPGHGQPGFDAAALRGQVTVVNFFASWCAPCRVEHPVFMRLAREGVVIYGVAYRDQADAARVWLGQLGNPYRAIGYDIEGRVAIDFGVYGVPETYLIDREGRVRYKHVGAVTQDVWIEQFLPRIRALGGA